MAYNNRGALKCAKRDWREPPKTSTKLSNSLPDRLPLTFTMVELPLSTHNTTGTAPLRIATKQFNLSPGLRRSYGLRGKAKKAKGDLAGAISDFTKEQRLKSLPIQ